MAKQIEWPYYPQPGGQEDLWRGLGKKEPAPTILFFGPRGIGKAQPIDSQILTARGWRELGKIKVGDLIMNPDGTTQKVIQIHEQGIKPVYKITMMDGGQTRACKEHLWTATLSNRPTKVLGKKECRWLVYSTEMLMDQLSRENSMKSRPLLPLPEPLNFANSSKNKLPIDPYVMGVLLGDGSFRTNGNIGFTSADPEIIDRIKSKGYDLSKNSAKYQYFFVGPKNKELRTKLNRIGLWMKKSEDKFIPNGYLFTSPENRIELLRGLLDTDGTADKNGYVIFYSVSEKMAKTVQQIVWSLGGRAVINIKKTTHQDCYVVNIQTKFNTQLFHLKRKKIRCKDAFNGGYSELKRAIVSIEPDGEAECRCITVSNPNSLYITDDYIVTHNSYGLRSAFATILSEYPLEACIVRKTYTDLRENHVIPMRNELKDYIDRKIIKLNMGELAYIFPNGSRLQFQYCMRDADLDRFQGRSYDLMGIEEAGQFTEHQIVVMLAANRASPTAGKFNTIFPQKAALTFNWGGPGHRYLKRIAHDKIYLPEKGESADKFKSIIGMYEDNKIFQQLDPDYQKRLMRLPLQLQRAWIDGDPDAFTGTVFTIVDQAHEVDPNNLLRNHAGLVPVSWQLFGALDPGTSAPCSFGLYCKNPDGQIFKIFNYYERDRNPEQHSFAILDAIKSCKWTNGRLPSYIVSGSDAFNRKNKRDIYAHDVTWKDVFRERGLYLARTDTGSGSRRRGYHAMQMLLHYEYSVESNEFTKLPKLRFFRGACKSTLDELRELEGSEYDPEDVKQGPEVADHAYDETRYAIMGAATPMAAEDEQSDESALDIAYKTQQLYESVNGDEGMGYAWDETF